MALRNSLADLEEGEPVLIGENVSADQYFAMPETMQPHNLIEGRLYMSPSPFWNHQKVVGRIFIAIEAFSRGHGGEAFVSPMDCKLGDRTVLQPDVGYISAGRTHIIQDHVMGPPDLVVEVLSKGTRRFDRQKKMEVYARYGVREAWLVDPVNATVTVLGGDGSAWVSESTVHFGETIPSSIVGLGAAGLDRPQT